MYRIYGKNKIKGWEKIDSTADKEKAFSTANKLNAKEYYSYMIIENNGNGDSVIAQESLYEECKVEYVDELKTKYEVKAVTFKPSRMKKKEELRRMTEDFIDR